MFGEHPCIKDSIVIIAFTGQDSIYIPGIFNGWPHINARPTHTLNTM